MSYFDVYNTNINPLTQLTQGRYNLENLLSNGYSNSVFTNVIGEPNFDAIAGCNVAQSLFQVGCAAFHSLRSDKKDNKSTEVDNQAQINQTNKQIEKYIDQQSKLIDANAKIDDNIKDLNTKLENLKADPEKNKKEIDDINKKIEELKAKKQENDTERTVTIENKIKDLKEEKDNYQKELETQKQKELDDKLDGNWLTRAKKSCLNENITYDKNDNPASKKEIKTAYYMFVNETNKNDKLRYANKFKEMYESNDKLAKTHNEGYDLIIKWLEKNTPKTEEA